MDSNEFRSWFSYHAARYPVAKWMNDNGDSQATMAAWAEVLGDVTLDDAMEATRLMYRGDEECPHGYSNHPKAVRQIAKRLSQGETEQAYRKATQIIDGQIVYSCQPCQDTGIRTIQHPEFIRRVKEAGGRPERIGGTRCTVACTCQSGDIYARKRTSPLTRRQIPALTRFNAKYHSEYYSGWTVEQEIEAALNFGTFTAETWNPDH